MVEWESPAVLSKHEIQSSPSPADVSVWLWLPTLSQLCVLHLFCFHTTAKSVTCMPEITAIQSWEIQYYIIFMNILHLYCFTFSSHSRASFKKKKFRPRKWNVYCYVHSERTNARVGAEDLAPRRSSRHAQMAGLRVDCVSSAQRLTHHNIPPENPWPILALLMGEMW